jgi:hypothetical protein
VNLQKTVDGVLLDVSVKPNAKKFEIQLDCDTVLVLVPEAPVKGKVNKELLKRLSKLFGKRVELVSGFSSREKKFVIYDIDVQDVERILVGASKT